MVYLVGLVRSFSVVLGLLGCVLRATTKKGHFLEKVHPRENPGYPYGRRNVDVDWCGFVVTQCLK